VGYQTLYRKYRPQTFAEVVGQQHVATILRNSVQQGRISHAYLFSGPRGTGKTSVARIFAKALNCPSAKDGEPCGTCEICKSIAAGNAPDIIEIDAASNRGIDDIRDLREKVHYAPARFNYKVYIIDEAHMITPQGFNALLKTLEEPPAHAIFILCTTEPHKLPLTILSRLLKLEFHRLPLEPLAAHAQKIAQQEKTELTRAAALELAKLAEGSVRDTISLLEQAMAFTVERIDEPQIDELFHLASPEQIVDLAVAVLRSRKDEIAHIAEELILSGRDPERMLLELASALEKYLLNRAQLRAALEARDLPYCDVTDDQLVAAVSECWEASSHLRREANPSLLFRITLYRIAHVLGRAQQAALGRPEESAKAVAPAKPPAKPPVPEAPRATSTSESTPAKVVKKEDAKSRGRSPSPPASELVPEQPAAAQAFSEATEAAATPSPPTEAPPLFSAEGKPQEAPAAGNEQQIPQEKGASSDADIPASRSKESGELPQEDAQTDPRWEALLDSIRSESITTFCLLFEGPEPEVKKQHLVLRFPDRLRFFSQLLRQASNLRVLDHFVKTHYGPEWVVDIVNEAPGREAEEAERAARDVLDLFPGSREIELGQ